MVIGNKLQTITVYVGPYLIHKTPYELLYFHLVFNVNGNGVDRTQDLLNTGIVYQSLEGRSL
jgi:hypothetical protein